MLRAGVQAHGKYLPPRKSQPVAHGLRQPQPRHAAGEVVHHARRQPAVEQGQRFVEPLPRGRGVQRQRRIEQRPAHFRQRALHRRQPAKRLPRRRVFQIALAEQQLHAALADGRFVRRFLARHYQRGQQRVGRLRLIRASAHALVPVVAVAEMVVQRRQPVLFDLRRLEFVQRLREQVARRGVLHQRKSRDLRRGDHAAAPEDGQDHALQRRRFAAARLADEKQVRVFHARHAQHFLDEAARAPRQHRHRLGRFIVGKQRRAQLHEPLCGDGRMFGKRRFYGRALLHLHHVRHFLAARRKRPRPVHICPAAVALVEAQRLHAALHLPFQPGEISLEHFEVAVAAHVAQRDGALVEHRLEFLRRGEVRGHERQAEGLAVHGRGVTGHLRFLVRHEHFQRMHHKIGQRVDVLAALAHIAPVGLEHAQLAAR